LCLYWWIVDFSAQLGCHNIGHMFEGALAYTDNLVLLAPTPHPMLPMLQCRTECWYAKEYNVLFNADKSKCIIISRLLKLATELILWATSLIISGNVSENIDSLPQLSNNGSDELDIMSHHKLVKSIMWSVGFCLYKNETRDALLRHWQLANYWLIQKPGILTLISVDCIEHAITLLLNVYIYRTEQSYQHFWPVLYTVSHKKHTKILLCITSANVDWF